MKVNEDLKRAFAEEGIRILRSDNICLGGKIPLPDETTGIIVEEMEALEKC